MHTLLTWGFPALVQKDSQFVRKHWPTSRDLLFDLKTAKGRHKALDLAGRRGFAGFQVASPQEGATISVPLATSLFVAACFQYPTVKRCRTWVGRSSSSIIATTSRYRSAGHNRDFLQI